MVIPIDRSRLLELIDSQQAQIVDVLPSREYDEERQAGSHCVGEGGLVGSEELP